MQDLFPGATYHMEGAGPGAGRTSRKFLFMPQEVQYCTITCTMAKQTNQLFPLEAILARRSRLAADLRTDYHKA
jgi:hypothetical protein